MATLIHPLALSGSRLSDGTVNAGGRVFLYRPGSANIRVTGYADKDKLEALTLSSGGYLLDAAGKLAVFVDEPCTANVYDQTGAPVDSFTIEPAVSSGLVEVIADGWTGVNPDTGQYEEGERTWLKRILSSLATSLGGLDGNFSAGASATDRPVYAAINDLAVSVKSFGAVGNGVADDTSAIQRAINFVTAAGGGEVKLPLGTYIISSALTITLTGVDLVGSGSQSTIIKSNNGTANGITITGAGINRIERLQLTHSATSTGTAVTTNGSVRLSSTVIAAKFRTGMSMNSLGVGVVVASSVLANPADAASVGINGPAVILSSGVSGAATGLTATGGSVLYVVGSTVSASAATGVGIALGLCDLYVSASTLSGGASGHGLTIQVISSGSGVIRIGSDVYCIPDVLDSRDSAPVIYSLGSNGSVTPLPMQTDALRIIATAAITVTIAAAAVGVMGQLLTIMCVNSSGGAVTWTFNAQYKTSGAVAPATGNGISVTFRYDAVSLVYREVSRSAAVPI